MIPQEFRGALFLSLTLLGLSLTLGYVAIRVLRERGRRKALEERAPPRPVPTPLERELAGEIAAARAARSEAGAPHDADTPALGLPEDERRRLEEVRRLDDSAGGG